MTIEERFPSEEEVLTYFDRYSNWGRWGDDDEAGTLNLITPEVRRRAAALVADGEVVSCAKTLTRFTHVGEPPLHGPPMHLIIQSGEQYAGRATEPGKLQSSKDYFGLACHSFPVTHLDAVSHVYWNGVGYNGRSAATCTVTDGCTFGSIDVAGEGIVSRGVLLDIPRLRTAPWVRPDEPIVADELRSAAAAAGLDLEPGDVLIVRTGIGRRIAEEGDLGLLDDGLPGLSPNCIPLLHEWGVAVLACDTGSDCLPNPYSLTSVPIHQVGLTAMGLWLLDNCALERLADECARRERWQFLFSVGPLRIEYGTGSAVNPLAIF